MPNENSTRLYETNHFDQRNLGAEVGRRRADVRDERSVHKGGGREWTTAELDQFDVNVLAVMHVTRGPLVS